MSANELAEVVASKYRLTKMEGRRIVKQIFSTITCTLKDGREVWIPDFGKLSTERKPERFVINPRNGLRQLGKSKVIPRLRFSGVIKGELNKSPLS